MRISPNNSSLRGSWELRLAMQVAIVETGAVGRGSPRCGAGECLVRAVSCQGASIRRGTSVLAHLRVRSVYGPQENRKPIPEAEKELLIGRYATFACDTFYNALCATIGNGVLLRDY